MGGVTGAGVVLKYGDTLGGMDGDDDGRPWHRGYLGLRVAIATTFLNGVLSVATGIVATANREVVGLGLLVPPEAAQVAGFTGTLTGFVLLVSALGLRRGLGISWYGTMVLLPLTLLQGLIQGSVFSAPLVALAVVNILQLFRHRDRFDRGVSLTVTQIAAGLALAGVQVYGTVGTWALRENFSNVSTVTDAFYFTIVTASTVGFGDITPQLTGPNPELAKWFAMSVVIFGTASFATALGVLLGPLIEARFARALGRMTEQQLELLEDHVLVLGYGDLTEPIVTELAESDIPFVVVTPDETAVRQLSDRDIAVVAADPSDEEPLERAQLESARAVLVATNDDAEDALAVLTARQLRPGVRIVAAATDRENTDKLRRAGADTVISPAVIGSHLLVSSALGSEDSEAIVDRLLTRE